MIRFFLISLGVISTGLLGFVIAIDHPKTRGHVRCWITETFYDLSAAPAPVGTPVVAATRSTSPVRDLCDAADDPAIWVDNESPLNSLILGTNKLGYINTYNLDGELLSSTTSLGAPNNVDLRDVDGDVLVVASDKDDGAQEVFLLDQSEGMLHRQSNQAFSVAVEDEAYGACLYLAEDNVYSFITDKSGLITQYLLSKDQAGWNSKHVRAFRVPSQPEACVVHDQSNTLFVGEEDVGIWRFDAQPDAKTKGEIIAKTGQGGSLSADVEGLAIYKAENAATSFLIASSQGDHTYAVYELEPPHRFRGRFQISVNGDLVGDTDGLEVTSKYLGPEYPKGMLVVQDGLFRDNEGNRRQQRFTYVSWAEIESILSL